MSKNHTLFPTSLVLLFVLLNSANLLQANNDLKFNHITVNDGLLHNSATCVAQDSSGFIWIGTQRGLNRFDGYKIDSYLNKTDLYTTAFYNRIKKIGINGDIIWVATLQGLQCFDIRKKDFIEYVDENEIGFANLQIIHNLKVDIQNRLWVTSNGKLECALVTKNNNEITLKRVKINNNLHFKLSDNSSPNVVELSNGVSILLANRKLYQLQIINTQNIQSTPLFPSLSFVSKIKSIGNELWLFFPDKAIVLLNSKGKFKQVDEIAYPTCSIVDAEFSSEFIWLSTNLGVVQLAKSKSNNRVQIHSNSVLDPYSVCSDHQSDILIDKQNNLWVTTWSGGVSYTSIGKQKFELLKYLPIKSNKYLPSEFVYSIHEDNKGHIYVGTKFGGISRFNLQTKTFDYTINLHEKLGVKALVPCIVSDDNWIYAVVSIQGSSIYRIHKTNLNIELVKSYNQNTVFSIGFDNHKQLWVGVLGMGLSCLKIENGRVISEKLYTNQSDPELNLSSNEVNYVFNDIKKNEVLVSTYNGINRLMLDQKGDVSAIAYYLADENNPKTLSSNFVWPIDKQNDSTYWVGTMGAGLNKIIIGKRVEGTATYTAERYGINEGAPSNNIESVLVDKFGNVWCGGNYLSRFNYKTKKFKTYYEEDGLQSYLFATGSSCKTRNGLLFFGGLKGLNYFVPDTIVEKHQYKVFFSRLTIDGKVLSVGDTLNGSVVLKSDLQFLSKVKLPYPCSQLSIEFTSLTYSQKKNIQYRYKLEGYDKDWIYTNGLNPIAMYPKLPYKSYHFIVEVLADNQWVNSGAELEIKILPPWWQSFLAYLFYFIFLLALFYIAARYSLNWMDMKRQISFQNEREMQKEELMELKMNFFTNISHEFKTPLTLINASVAEIETKYEQLVGNRYFQILKRNNLKLLHLISELMDFQRSNASLIQLKTTQIDVCNYVQEIVEEFQPLSNRSGIALELTMPSEPLVAWVDEEFLTKIISNIISNSIRYTESGGSIKVQLSIGKLENYKTQYNSKIAFTNEMLNCNQMIFTVTDTGIGITTESLPDVFERFHTIVSKTSKHLGSGIGLALVKSFVELHRGGVIISSERYIGTEFVFFLPLEPDYLTPNQKTTEIHFDRQVYFDDYKVRVLDDQIIHLPTQDDQRPTLLIVDDNKDILMILSDHFKCEFNILTALDGQQGLDLCNEKFPDIIISDIMMPNMTGLELCQRVKSQLNTSFIPVVLLSARGTTEQQIEGLDEGADAYIPKPFHVGLLHSTIINLLNKSKLTNKLIKPVNNDIVEIKSTRNAVLDAEKLQFVEKITQLIESNIDNASFTVDNLCMEIGISRSRLYAQMKSITNETLGDFIREVRLRRAAELLRTTSLTISEVASQVGIFSPSFFTRSFKQRFGMPPSEYIKKILNEGK